MVPRFLKTFWAQAVEYRNVRLGRRSMIRATVNILGHRVTIAWDQQTKAVTYLFTDDPRLIGDSELSVGGSCRIAGDSGRGDSRLIKYRQWLVTEDWRENFSKWSGKATWYAALDLDSAIPGRAIIVGFVQSRYLKLH